jgi:hypothetical protein
MRRARSTRDLLVEVDGDAAEILHPFPVEHAPRPAKAMAETIRKALGIGAAMKLTESRKPAL